MQTSETCHSICLVSGGMDSCVTAAVALQQGPAAFLHVSYGQRTWERERQSFRRLADHYGVGLRKEIALDYLREIGGSALTDPSIPVPMDGLQPDQIPVSYVPFRNANFLAIAVSWAEVLGVHNIYIGAVENDSSGYPDCRQSFFEAFNQAVKEGTRPETEIRIHAPLLRLKKSEIVRWGSDLGAPFHLTWSCYQESEKACGRCDSCLLRLKAFAEAGRKDPIPYR